MAPPGRKLPPAHLSRKLYFSNVHSVTKPDDGGAGRDCWRRWEGGARRGVIHLGFPVAQTPSRPPPDLSCEVAVYPPHETPPHVLCPRPHQRVPLASRRPLVPFSSTSLSIASDVPHVIAHVSRGTPRDAGRPTGAFRGAKGAGGAVESRGTVGGSRIEVDLEAWCGGSGTENRVP